nr:SUMF1/EgtB/PvdO family nonheme iron enzyme [Pirellulales bacterium]
MRFHPAFRHPLCLLLLLPAWMAPASSPAATPDTSAATTATPLGFVVGDARPEGEGPFFQVSGGWMVPYEETIPGSSVTFRMIPVPGGTFRMGSPDAEEGRTSDEGPVFEVAVAPFWMSEHEVTWGEYKRYMAACDLFLAMQSAKIRPIDG